MQGGILNQRGERNEEEALLAREWVFSSGE